MESKTRETLQSLGKRVQELRRVRGLTQEKLAEKLGMLPPNFARIEQGRMNTTVDTLVRIASALGVDVWELFTEPGNLESKAGRPRKG